MGSYIESVGIYKDPNTRGELTTELIRKAGEACFKASKIDKSEIRLIIQVSSHRYKEVVEPATAAYVQRDLAINCDFESSEANKTVSFDLNNGSVGFLQGCQIIDLMIATGKAKAGMVVSGNSKRFLGTLIAPENIFCEMGMATLVAQSPSDRMGFSSFFFKIFPDMLEVYRTYVEFKEGKWYSGLEGDPNYERSFLDAVSSTVAEYLKREGVSINSFDIIVAPQVSSAFIKETAKRLGGEQSRYMDVSNKEGI